MVQQVSGATLTYTADQDWNGTETFTYKANDGSLDSNTSTITITVTPVNDTPVVTGGGGTGTADDSDVLTETLSIDFTSSATVSSVALTDGQDYYLKVVDQVHIVVEVAL